MVDTGHWMRADSSFEDLWRSAATSRKGFDPAQVAALPASAQRYLRHAIETGTPLASAVRLAMHGEIKLKRWYPFSAEEVIHWRRGMMWRATVHVGPMSIRGADSFIDGAGSMRWKLFGVIPIVNASGSDMTRSAAGRVNIESIWLPSALCAEDVTWKASGQAHLDARFRAHGETAHISYVVDDAGALHSVSMPRWGNPEGADFHYLTCGGLVEQEQRFGGYTIPTRMRVGWHFGTERFEADGEFFRVTIDDASFR